MDLAAGYIVIVVQRDGRVIHNPQHPESCGEFPWDWCWRLADRKRWREAFIEACMFRRPQQAISVSLRFNDALFDYETWLEPAGDELVVCRMVRRYSQTLTAQERAVLSLVAGGTSNQAIAQALGITSATVRSHMAAMRRKLNVSRSEGLLLAALQMGIAPGASPSAAVNGDRPR